MSSGNAASVGAAPAIGFFERYLTVWVVLCIVGGIFCGEVLPQLCQMIGRIEVAHVNLPVGVLIWVMIIPMLVKIDFSAMSQVRSPWRGIGVTLFVNWLASRSRWRSLGGSSSGTCLPPGCPLNSSTATSPVSFCWPQRRARLGVRLCRPSERVLEVLPAPRKGGFTKEDGERVVDAEGRRIRP